MTLVMTTVALPAVLESYASNAARFGRTGQVEAIVIGDRKTPAASAEYLAALFRRWGFRAEYVGVDAQRRWLARYPELDRIIPYDSDNRRNIGFLMALERGCDILLSIDDDNYCAGEDFYAAHSVAGSVVKGPVISSRTGWFNIGSMLESEPAVPFFPRGFPVSKRNGAAGVRSAVRAVPVDVNAGLWIEDPDIDAAARLTHPIKTTRLKSGPVILGPAAHSPINTQNTAVARDAAAAYYYVIMGHDLGGAKLDRYGDIWSGFFLKKCADHLGRFCMVGRPLARHIRNRHDLFVDLQQELYGMMLTDPLVDILCSLKLAGGTYAETYRDLSRKLEKAIAESDHPYFTPAARRCFRKICSNMRIWTDVCSGLL